MCSESVGRLDIEEAAHFDRYNLVAELQRALVANRGRVIAENQGILGRAMPRSCLEERSEYAGRYG